MRMAPLGLDNLIVVNEEARHAAFEVARRGAGGVDSKQEGKQVRICHEVNMNSTIQ